ncbi:hypothetical protein [Alloactinosynnema sp. L-07]|nr:hypothetical protein [Alloactinosynnema sp. L-07]
MRRSSFGRVLSGVPPSRVLIAHGTLTLFSGSEQQEELR